MSYYENGISVYDAAIILLYLELHYFDFELHFLFSAIKPDCYKVPKCVAITGFQPLPSCRDFRGMWLRAPYAPPQRPVDIPTGLFRP